MCCFAQSPCLPFDTFGGVTYSDVLQLPNSTNILLVDGQQGRIVAWLHTAEMVTVSAGGVLRNLHCQALRVGAGMVIEIPGGRPNMPPAQLTHKPTT